VTRGIIGARVAAGLALAGLSLLLLSRAVADFGRVNATLWGVSIVASALVAAINVVMRLGHYRWWLTCHKARGPWMYIVVNAFTGAPLVALTAYSMMFVAIAGFMAA
jgi:hypothetical protein